jgi:hypothetical protein
MGIDSNIKFVIYSYYSEYVIYFNGNIVASEARMSIEIATLLMLFAMTTLCSL